MIDLQQCGACNRRLSPGFFRSQQRICKLCERELERLVRASRRSTPVPDIPLFGTPAAEPISMEDYRGKVLQRLRDARGVRAS